MEEVSRLFNNIIEVKEIQLVTNIEEGAEVLADPELFACILRNLLSNAIKYTPNHGQISIIVYKANTYMHFEITDTGVGFQNNTFDKLIKAEHSISVPGVLNENGSGLGLKLCKEFVAMHHGKIWMEPVEHAGSKICFNICLKQTAEYEYGKPKIQNA
jgi:signal transduction histidine kinase